MAAENVTADLANKGDPSCPNSREDLVDSSAGLAVLGLVLSVSFYIYTLAGLLWFYKRRKYSIRLRGRRFSLLCISSVGFCFLSIPFIRNFVGKNRFPCIILDLTIPLVVTLGVWSVIVRALSLMNRVKYRILLTKNEFTEYLRDHKYTDTDLLILDPAGLDDKPSSLGIAATLSRKLTANVRDATRSFSKHSPSMGSSDKASVHSGSTTSTRIKVSLPAHISRAKFYASSTFATLLVAIPALIVNGAMLIIRKDSLHCKGCDDIIGFGSDSKNLIITVVLIALAVVAAAYSISLIRKEPDPLKIRAELFHTMLVSRPVGLIWIILSLVDPGDLDASGKFDWMILIFIVPIFLIYNFLYKNIRYSYISQNAVDMNSVAGSKRTSLNLDNNVEFETLLNSKIGQFCFQKHLTNELSIENYFFWLEASKWKKRFSNSSKSHRENRFMFLYEMFLNDEDAPLMINLEDSIYRRMRELANKERIIEESSLDEAIKATYNLMCADSFPRFKRGKFYQEYKSQEIDAENYDPIFDKL